MAALVAWLVKNLPVMQETWVQSLGLEDFFGEGNGNPLKHCCLENPMDGGAWCRLLSMESQRVGTTERLHFLLPGTQDFLK